MNNKILKITTILISIIIIVSCRTTRSIESVLNDYKTTKLEIIEKSEGDINLDGITDLVIVTKNKINSKKKILVFLKDKKSNVIKEFLNENIISTDEDEEYHFSGIKIKNGTLSITFYGGMCHREGHELIFKYNLDFNDLYFETLKISTHNVCNDSEPNEYEETNRELRKLKFVDYTKEH